jgi:hypothetical protein
LQHFSGKIEGKILRIDHSLDKAKPLRDEFFTIICDENTSDVKLNVVLLSLRFKEIERSALGDKQDCAEFQLSFHREMFDGEMILPIVGQRLVKAAIFLLGDLRGIAGPQWFGLVQLFNLLCRFLDLLSLFCLLIFLFIDLLNLRLLIAILFLCLFFFFLLDFLFSFFRD